MSRSYWSDTRRCCTLFSRSATKRTGFAVTFHRQRRGKRQTETALSEIPGVGVKTAQKLLKEFGSVATFSGGFGKIEQHYLAKECRENPESAWCFDAPVTGSGGT